MKCVQSHSQWTWKQEEEIDFNKLYVLSLWAHRGVQLQPEWQTHWCKSKINPESENAGKEDPLSAASHVADQWMKHKKRKTGKKPARWPFCFFFSTISKAFLKSCQVFNAHCNEAHL